MGTSTCPRCHQPVNSQAVNCPSCGTTLKAFGHPGIPLHRATSNNYLCDNCTYHADDTCNFPQRPYAKECTLYQDIHETQLNLQQQHLGYTWRASVKNWINRYQALLLLLGLLLFCLIIVLLTP